MAATMQKKRLFEYQRGLIIMVAFLSEARIRECAVKQVDFFIEGPEGSENDAAIYVGQENLQTRQGAANTLFVELRARAHKKILAAVDIKHLAAKCDSKMGTSFSIHLQAGQRRTCQAVIAVSPKEPDFVLLIPIHYLPETNQKDTLDVKAVRPLWTLHPMLAFPSEYTAFVTPLAQLGRRLENMRGYFRGSADAWGNEYTGVSFTGVPPPRLSDASVVTPTILHARNALERLRRYFTAFDNRSTRFRLDLIGVRPFGGDFKIIEKGTEQEVFVELKDGLVEVIHDRRSGLQVLRHPAVNSASGKPIFSWKAQWDYLLSADAQQRYAYFFPRDKLPADWWDRDGVVEMSEGFQAYRIDVEQPQSIVDGIEQVLATTRAETGSMRARYVRPVRPLTHEALQEIPSDGGGQGPVGRYTWSTTGLRRGFGSAQHGELRKDTYGQWASEVLIELCRASGEAVVLDFGVRNPQCRFAIALYRWSDMDRVRYDRDGEPPARVWNFPNDTPVVPLTFVGGSWTGDWQPRPGREFIRRITALKSRAASLVILDLYPENCLRMSHSRFVFASEHAHPNPGRGVRGLVRQGLLERFAVSSGNLIKVITAPLRGDEEIALGIPRSTIRAMDYCFFIRDFHQAGVHAL